VTTAAVMDGPSNPLVKEAVRQPGAWMANYAAHPWMMAAPALGLVGPLLVWGLSAVGRAGTAFIASGLGIAGVVGTAGVSMFPFLMPSSVAPSASLTVWDASSSHVTLFVMLVATLIFLPIVLAYTGFVFRTLRGTVSPADVQRHSNSLY
jgi:cytochrome bd ubiquinol oxidase subunit II